MRRDAHRQFKKLKLRLPIQLANVRPKENGQKTFKALRLERLACFFPGTESVASIGWPFPTKRASGGMYLGAVLGALQARSPPARDFPVGSPWRDFIAENMRGLLSWRRRSRKKENAILCLQFQIIPGQRQRCCGQTPDVHWVKRKATVLQNEGQRQRPRVYHKAFVRSSTEGSVPAERSMAPRPFCFCSF